MVADGRVREAAGASSDAEDVDASAGADPVMSEADAAAVVAPDDAAGGGSVVRAELWRFVELLALCGLAVTQPLLDLYGRNPEQFVGRAGLGEATLFALAVATVPAVLLFAITIPLRLISPGAERTAHRVVLAALLGLAVVQLFPAMPPAGRWALGVGAAAAMAFLLFRVQAISTWIRALAFAPALFVGVFIFASDVTPVIFPDEGTSQGAVPVGNPIPVVWLTLDELPLASLLDGEGQIDADLFPNFARLASGSSWYRNATTVSPNTALALPALVTGTYPERDGSIAGRYPDSVFSVLSATHSMNVQEPVSKVCPEELCPPYTQGSRSSVGDLLSSATRTWWGRLFGEEITEENRVELGEFVLQADGVAYHDPDRLTYWIDQLDAGPKPGFHFLHAVLPHFPWIYTPSGYRYDNQPHWKFERAGLVWSGNAGVEAAQLRHLLQLQYVDAWLGAMIDELQATGLWDEALVIVTADHGMSFQPDQFIRGIDVENAWEVMWVPMFIRGPGFTPGAVSDEDVTTLDVVPTLADVLDIELPWEAAGVSLLRQPIPEHATRYLRDSQFNALEADESGYVTADARVEFPRLLQAARKGQGDDDLRLWRTGEYASLVGQPLTALQLTATAGEPIELDLPSLPLVFDPSNFDIPVAVVGKVPVNRDAGTNLAISLNGTIVAVPSFSQVNRSFATLLPETRLAEGENSLRLFLLTGPPSAPTAVEYLPAGT